METMRTRKISRIFSLVVGATILAGCTPESSTTEGSASRQCTDGTQTFALDPEQQHYLGDLSTDPTIIGGVHNDYFLIENKQGAVRYEQDNRDDGEVSDTNGGFIYTENENRYKVTFENSPNNATASVEVTVIAECV